MISVERRTPKPKGDLPPLVNGDHLDQKTFHERYEAMPNVRAIYGERLAYTELPMDALDGADALAIVTEWGEFRNPEFDEMKSRMAQPVIFDGRNLYNPRQMKSLGFTYQCIGKPPV
jgi:UDPglucose 6-dehydrogenase